MSDPRFLVVRLGSLGDIVHTFPAVSGLRQSFPRAELLEAIGASASGKTS